MPGFRFAWLALGGRSGQAQVANLTTSPNWSFVPDYFRNGPSTSRDHVEIEMRAIESVDQGALLIVDQIVGLFIVIVDDGEDAQRFAGGNQIDRLHAVYGLESLGQSLGDLFRRDRGASLLQMLTITGGFPGGQDYRCRPMAIGYCPHYQGQLRRQESANL